MAFFPATSRNVILNVGHLGICRYIQILLLLLVFSLHKGIPEKKKNYKHLGLMGTVFQVKILINLWGFF